MKCIDSTAQSDRDYEEAFRSAGLGTDQEMAETVAARVSDSSARKALVAALDDWASCTGDSRRDWLLKLARLADPDPWRDRARDAAVWEDRAKLTELTDAAPVKGQSLTLLLAVGEQLQLAGDDRCGHSCGGFSSTPTISGPIVHWRRACTCTGNRPSRSVFS